MSLPLADLAEGFEPLGLDALAARLGVSRTTAWRVLERLRGAQHRPDVLRVVKIKVPIGSGAQREALHVLWPRSSSEVSAAPREPPDTSLERDRAA